MKLRKGFVSNSSSASFVVKRVDLTDAQIDLIKHYSVNKFKVYCKENNIEDIDFDEYLQEWYDDWNITEIEDHILGKTIIDNFEFFRFFEIIGVKYNYNEDG